MTCLRELYGTADYTPTARDDNFVAIGGFLEQYPNYDDLYQFEQTERPDAFAANYTFSFQSVNGGLNTQNGLGNEADLGKFRGSGNQDGR